MPKRLHHPLEIVVVVNVGSEVGVVVDELPQRHLTVHLAPHVKRLEKFFENRFRSDATVGHLSSCVNQWG